MADSGSEQLRGNGQLIKSLNRSRILECLQQGEPLSRVELAARTGISLPAVVKLVEELEQEGLVVCVGAGPSSGGRRPLLFAYNSRAGYVVGLDVGATKIAGGILDLEGNILATETVPTHSTEPSPVHVGERVKRLVEQLVAQTGVDLTKVLGIGIGVPGIPDAEGNIGLAPGLHRDQSRIVDDVADERRAFVGSHTAIADRGNGQLPGTGHLSPNGHDSHRDQRWADGAYSNQRKSTEMKTGGMGNDGAGSVQGSNDDEIVALGAYLQAELGRPVYMDNDVNAFLRGEAWKGALQGAKHAVAVTIGTGIGVALLVNGDVYQGARGSAGEIGYWLIGALGPIARSSGYGPLESFAAGPGIARRYVARLKARGGSSAVLDLAGGDMRNITARLVAEGAMLGDSLALDVWRETAETLGVALANLCCLMDPEVLVLAGGVSRAPRELLLDPVRRIVETLVPYPPKIVLSQLKEQAAILGAAALVLESRRSSISYTTAAIKA